MPLGVERSSHPNAVIPPNSFFLWPILPPFSSNGLDPVKGKIIILIETISNIYSHAQPQSRSTAGIRRGG